MSTTMASRAATSAALFMLALLVACADSTNPTVVDPPPVPVASVSVTPPTQPIVVGTQVTLAAQPKDAEGRDLDRPITWTSENESLATVSAAGVVTTLAVGEVGILATSEGKTGRAALAIHPIPPVPVAEVRLSVQNEIVLEWDGRTQITATAFDAEGRELADRHVQWTSSRPAVAAVWSGNIEAVNPGSATIRAVIDGVAASVGVLVKMPQVTAVVIEAGTTGVEVGETFIFASRVKRANGAETYEAASWASTDPAVLRVGHQDMGYAAIEALAEGTATLAASVEGVSARLSLRVTQPPTQDLVYNRVVGTASELFTLDIRPPGVPARINAGNVSRDPSPSPDGTQFVFAVSQRTTLGELQNDLYVVNRNGLNMRWLTRAPGLEDEPQWSPDGTRILFRGDADGRSDLYTINVDGTGLTKLTSALVAQVTQTRHPAWSPDGSRIAFIGVVGSNYKVWTIRADGSDARQVTTDAGFDMQPTFSPDGREIAFVRYNTATPGNGDDIMIVSSDGGTPRRLSLPGDQRSPAWSADGRYLAVSGNAIAGRGVDELYTLRPDGTGLRLRTVNPAWGGGLNPAWVKRP